VQLLRPYDSHRIPHRDPGDTHCHITMPPMHVIAIAGAIRVIAHDAMD
jgi:hypothetical protein